MKQIRIVCSGADLMSIDEMIHFQHDLKNLSEENYQKIKLSITDLGFSEPISIWQNEGKNYILGGHQRHTALKKMREEGYEIPPIPVSYIEADDIKQAKKKVLALTSQFGAMTQDGLINFCEMNELNIEDMMKEFRFPEITSIGFNIGNEEAKDDDFDPSVISKKTDIAIGDLFEIGEHRLLCGDCTSNSSLEILMNGKKADIAFTSPPYNVGKTPNGNEKKYITDADNKDNSEYVYLLDSFTRNCLNFCDYVFSNIQCLSGNKVALIEHTYNLREIFADVMIWDKINAEPAMAHRVLNSRFEYIYIYSKEAKRSIGKKDFRGTIDNLFQLNSRQGKEYSDIHKATFPTQLPSIFINNFSLFSVLDPFLGTGSTMVACHQLKRICYGMELEPIYCQAIIERMLKLDPTLSIKKNGEDFTL